MTGCEQRASLAVVLIAALAACAAPPAPHPTGPPPECTSLLGDALYAPPLDPDRTAELRQSLADSLARLRARPTDPAALIDYGRWLAAVGRFDDAVATFSLGLQRWPDDVALLRHRGHREITLRRFDDAVADLTRASQLMEGQPDELEATIPPNASGLDLGWLHANVRYHLALAHFLQGQYELALDEWTACREAAPNDDVRVMCAYWQVTAAARAALAARTAGDLAHASELRRRIQSALTDVGSGLDVQEYSTYLGLALMWKGSETPGDLLLTAQRAGLDSVLFATTGYGVANFYLCHNEPARARALLEQVCHGASWQAFGHIAAEVELARMLAAPPAR